MKVVDPQVMQRWFQLAYRTEFVNAVQKLVTEREADPSSVVSPRSKYNAGFAQAPSRKMRLNPLAELPSHAATNNLQQVLLDGGP